MAEVVCLLFTKKAAGPFLKYLGPCQEILEAETDEVLEMGNGINQPNSNLTYLDSSIHSMHCAVLAQTRSGRISAIFAKTDGRECECSPKSYRPIVQSLDRLAGEMEGIYLDGTWCITPP